MTLFQRAFAGSETRGLNDPLVPLTAASLVDWLSGTVNDSGMRVTEKSAYSMPAVYRAVGLISQACAAVPLQGYDRKDRLLQTEIPVLAQPCPGMTAFEFWEFAYVCIMTWGNFYAWKNMNQRGEIESLVPIRPESIKVGQVRAARSPENPTGKMFMIASADGGEKPASPEQILHIPGLGYDGVTGVSPIRLAAQGIGTALAAEKYTAKQFSSGSLMAGVLQTEQRITPEQADELSARWRTKVAGLARAHDIVALGAGAKFQPIQFPNSDTQMMETRKFQVVEIARIFGIPPHMLGDVEKSTSWGTGIEQQSIGFVTYTLKPWLTRVEQRISLEVAPGDQFVSYDLNDLMRGDSQQRAAYYTAMRNIGALNADEIRDEEGRPPLPDGQGQTYMTPLNMGSAGTAPTDSGTQQGADNGGQDGTSGN
jgi:HK97 family phage portal protein